VQINNRMNICPNCGVNFPLKKNGRGGFTETCSPECGNELRSKRHYEEYKLDNSVAYGQSNMQNYKKWFLLEQENRCAICNMKNSWNDQELIFVLDHIDGDADNNERSNLRLVCPNCDSQLETFKSKNKNSARAKYRKA
jgi:transcription initiation factor IIE alpha subunit